MKLFFTIVAALIATVFLLGGGCVALMGIGAAALESEQGGSGISLAEFNKVQNGMSYSEVSRVFGSEGVVISANKIANIKTEMYEWRGKGLGNVHITFQNGRVMSKAQFGLK